MYKYFKATAAAVTVVVFNCILFSVRADGPLPTPSVDMKQFGANRRVITSRTGYTAVRGNFLLPQIKVSPAYQPGFFNQLANSKPSFYLGTSQREVSDSMEADAGVQYEWEIIPRRNDDNTITYIPPGWGIFSTASRIYDDEQDEDQPKIEEKFEANPRGGWRAGVGTENPFTTSFDLSWVMRPNGSGTNATPGFYGYLEVFAVGATTQPEAREEQPLEKHDGNPNNPARLVPFFGGGVTTTYTTNVMAAKRVVAITQGGSYAKNSFLTGRPVTPTPGILRFPLPSGGLYDEDGSQMIGCEFRGHSSLASGVSGFDGTSGQLSLGKPLRTQSSPPWMNWSNNINSFTNSSVDQGSFAEARNTTGFYPFGLDQTIFQLLERVNSSTAKPYFLFPGISDASSTTESRYNSETINISLRSGISSINPLVMVGQ